MLHGHLKPPDHDGLQRGGFWSIFEQSRIPMALVDRNRQYVDVNEAAIELYQYPRAEILGSRAGRTVVDGEPQDPPWEQLRATDELYGERVIVHANGTQMRVSYAAHGTTVDDRWLALFVTLSARFEPDGPELVGTADVERGIRQGPALTQREQEIVRMVALGSSTRAIAADLGLSSETVRTHVRNAMSKTGAHTRAHLVAVLLADGLIEN